MYIRKKGLSDPGPLLHETDPQIWIQIKIKRSHKTGYLGYENDEGQTSEAPEALYRPVSKNRPQNEVIV